MEERTNERMHKKKPTYILYMSYSGTVHRSRGNAILCIKLDSPECAVMYIL
jgi:hypothetical protein